MRQLLAIVFAGFLAMPLLAQDATETALAGETVEPVPGEDVVEPILDIRPADEIVLEEFLWLNRFIIIFANTDRDPNFREQLELLGERPGDLIERDVIIVIDTDPITPSAIRLQLRPRGFGFVLIDKDGVIKLRKPAPWNVREIVRSIDKTELRQQEARDALEAGE